MHSFNYFIFFLISKGTNFINASRIFYFPTFSFLNMKTNTEEMKETFLSTLEERRFRVVAM